MKAFIIISDSSNGSVYVSEYDTTKFDDYEDFYIHLNNTKNLNLSSSNCDCMIVFDELNISFI